MTSASAGDARPERPSTEGFPKRLRLRKRRQFLAVQRRGRRLGTEHFLVFARPNGGGPTRLGITVSKKVGKAVLRNRVKRLVREAFRRHTDRLPEGFDVVFVARQRTVPANVAAVVRDLEVCARRLAEAPRARGPRRRGGRG